MPFDPILFGKVKDAVAKLQLDETALETLIASDSTAQAALVNAQTTASGTAAAVVTGTTLVVSDADAATAAIAAFETALKT
jgi:hypothetical protein